MIQRRCATEKLACCVSSPLGKITLHAEAGALCGLYLPAQAALASSLGGHETEPSLPAFESTIEYLDAYFSKRTLPPLPRIDMKGTPFQQQVWKALCNVPWGETLTYGAIAKAVGRPNAFRAVGKAIGDNPISILVPCHRIIGRSGQLTGYAGGLEAKRWLLDHEQSRLYD